MLPNKTLIIKVTESCNFRCEYCYLGEESKQDSRFSLISNNVIAELFKKIEQEASGKLQLVWHGGEPTLVGTDFYKKLFIREQEIEKTRGKLLKIVNSIQTNGSRLEEYLQVFKEGKISIGVSFDGPKDIQDSHRHFANGDGSFDIVTNNTKKATENGFDISSITIVTRAHIGREKDIYEQLKLAGIKNAKFNPFSAVGSGESKKEDYSVTPDEFCTFLKNMYLLWINDVDGDKIELYPLKDLVRIIGGVRPKTCIFRGCKDDFIELDPTGDAYPCGRFIGLGKYVLGNITKDSIDFLLSQKSKLLSGVREGYDFSCAFESYLEHGTLDGISGYTAAYKDLLNFIKSDLEVRLDYENKAKV